MLSAREAKELSHVEARLLAKFVPLLRPEEVRRCVSLSAARHESARVRTYLMILIERSATDMLRCSLRENLTVTVVEVPVAQITTSVQVVSASSLPGLDVSSTVPA